MARSLEIPAIVGTKEITAKVKEGDILAVNGIEGDVIIDPTDEQKLNLKSRCRLRSTKAEWEN